MKYEAKRTNTQNHLSFQVVFTLVYFSWRLKEGYFWSLWETVGVRTFLHTVCLYLFVREGGYGQIYRHVFMPACLHFCLSGLSYIRPVVCMHVIQMPAYAVNVCVKACAVMCVCLWCSTTTVVCRSPIYSWWGLVLWRTQQIWGPKLDAIIFVCLCVCASVCVHVTLKEQSRHYYQTRASEACVQFCSHGCFYM